MLATAVLLFAAPAGAVAERLALVVPHHVSVHKAFQITVRGSGAAQDSLNVYLDHHRCAAQGAQEDSRTGTAHPVMEFGFHGRFSLRRTIVPSTTRRVFVCAYLTYPVGKEIAAHASYTPKR